MSPSRCAFGRFHPGDQDATNLALTSRMVHDAIRIPNKDRKPRPSFKEFSDAVRRVALATETVALALCSVLAMQQQQQQQLI